MRRRILVAMVATTVLALAAFAIPLGVAAARLYRAREVSRLEREATIAAGALPSKGLQGSDAIELPHLRGRSQLALYDRTGHRVVGEGPAIGDTEVEAAIHGRVADDHDGAWLAVAVPIRDEEQIVGAARAAAPWDVVAGDVRASWLVMSAFAIGAVGLAAAVASWLSSRLVAPIGEVAGLAVRLGEGDFGARMPPAGVSEIDRAADALNRTATRLGELVARERAFTADVSHQLNTPLTSLRLGLESALVTPGADANRAVAEALEEVERLHATVQTLLTVARDVDGRSEETCDVREVCTEVARRCTSALAAAGRPLRLDIDPALPRARCPSDVVREILAVLVDNALHHGAGSVTLAARHTGSGVVVDVVDEGAGVAADQAASLFRRRAPEASGHGIGLALARSLAEAHSARLELTRSGPHPVFALALAGSSPNGDR